jgi:hypothetical protein
VAPTTSTSELPPTDESDNASRSAAPGSFRLARAAASFPASPSGKGRETRILGLWPASKKTFRVDYNPTGALHMESRAKTTPRRKQNNSE